MKKVVLALLLILTMVFSLNCTTLIPVINTFEVSPGAVSTGSSSNLVWNVSGANSITITPIPGVVPAVGTASVNPLITTAYTITATGTFGIVSKSVVLVVNPVPIAINISANPAVLSSGNSAKLQWNITGASTASIDQGIGQIPLIGNAIVSPTQTTTYTITAQNASGSVNRTVVVAVNPPISASFSVTPTTINVGQAATLTWNVTGANTISIDNGIGQVAASGSRVVTPGTTTSYTLSAASDCCITNKAAVVTVGTVYPFDYYGNYLSPYDYMYGYPNWYYGGSPGGNIPLVPFVEIFSVNPTQVQSGHAALLYWNVVGASSVTITGIGNVSRNGSRVITPISTTTYTLTATNAYSSTASNVTVLVVP